MSLFPSSLMLHACCSCCCYCGTDCMARVWSRCGREMRSTKKRKLHTGTLTSRTTKHLSPLEETYFIKKRIRHISSVVLVVLSQVTSNLFISLLYQDPDVPLLSTNTGCRLFPIFNVVSPPLFRSSVQLGIGTAERRCREEEEDETHKTIEKLLNY